MTEVVYRPPGQDLGNINQEWSDLLFASSVKDRDVLKGGDLNVDLLKVQDHRLTLYQQLCRDYFLLSFLAVITQPTRITQNSATFIDDRFTNRVSKAIESTILIEDYLTTS